MNDEIFQFYLHHEIHFLYLILSGVFYQLYKRRRESICYVREIIIIKEDVLHNHEIILKNR